MKKILIILAVCLAVVSSAFAYNKLPGKGTTLKPARATWDTGYFQEAIIREAMQELGYKVEKPKDLSNPLFYQSLYLGDVDYWANGWFPTHDNQLPKNFYDKADKVGYVVKAGGLQGYLVSKVYAEKYNIKSLDDFKREEVKKAFDSNGDGKADLTACPPGWGCEKIIAHHMKAYKLGKDINLIKASYSASMAEELAKFKSGKPVFFYTWAPNWTIFKMKPGQDVVWINVPKIDPAGSQAQAVDRMTVADVTGAVSNPVKLGFVVSDIRVVANKKFLAKNPAAKKFFELFSLSLAEINEQNTKMNEGEKSDKDIQRHALAWIAKHQDTWNGWIEEARKAAD
ncbi:MAG: glycine betaine/L-proline ABC transporter substrate-binding protein ProX [Deferribacterales bacterium]